NLKNNESKKEFLDNWNSELKGKGMNILNNNQITNTSYCSIYGKKILSNGCHHYKFRIVKYNNMSSNWNHVIGISLETECLDKLDTYFKGYGFIGSQGKV